MIIFISHIVLPRGKTEKTKAISRAYVWNPNLNCHYSEPHRYFLSRFYYISNEIQTQTDKIEDVKWRW